MTNYTIPRANAPISGSDAPTIQWYNYFRYLDARSAPFDPSVIQNEITTIAEKLGSPDGNVNNIPKLGNVYSVIGLGSISTFGLNNVQVTLFNDLDAPNPVSFYGTDSAGAKGWQLLFDAFADTANIAATDTLGIVSFDLTDVTVGTGGALQKTAFDAKGRLSEQDAATAADLPVDTTGWHVLSGPSTQIALNSADSVLTSLGTMAFQNANAAVITGGSIDGATIGATTPSSGAFTVVTGSADAIFNGVNVGLGAGSVASNLSVGALALSSNTTGNNNVALGNNALHSNTTGTFNVGIGGLSLYNTTTASSMIAIGYLSLVSYTASGNALNIAIGSLASRYLASGTGNIAIGGSAGTLQTSGLNNVYLGNLSGLTLTSANANVSGSNNTYVGANSGPGTTTQLTNATAIGYSALCTASNQIVLGNASVTDSRVNGDWSVQNAGRGLRVAEGTNCKQGIAVLVAGVAVVSNTKVTANSRIQLTGNVDGGTPGWVRVSARVAGTSFTITSSSALDTSTVAYEIFEPA